MLFCFLYLNFKKLIYYNIYNIFIIIINPLTNIIYFHFILNIIWIIFKHVKYILPFYIIILITVMATGLYFSPNFLWHFKMVQLNPQAVILYCFCLQPTFCSFFLLILNLKKCHHLLYSAICFLWSPVTSKNTNHTGVNMIKIIEENTVFWMLA